MGKSFALGVIIAFGGLLMGCPKKVQPEVDFELNHEQGPSIPGPDDPGPDGPNGPGGPRDIVRIQGAR